MSITDELREFNREMYTEEELDDIADRIDVEHERKVDEKIEAIRRDVESGWVCLPVDADGVPIRVGDRLRFKSETCDKVFTATSVEWNGSRWMLMASDGGSVGYGGFDYLHHAQTTEDVLREMMFKAHVYSDDELCFVDDLAAEYAKRLQLKD